MTAANLGTTLGTAVGGMFIAELGTAYVVLAGLLFIALARVTIFIQLSGLTEKNFYLRKST